jgi:hypothetical protein
LELVLDYPIIFNNYIMKQIFWTLFIIIMFVPLKHFSQEMSFDKLNNTIGLNSSNISGYGFYYNRKITENFRIQFMCFAYYYYNDSNKEIHKIFNYDYGIELQRDLSKSENFRIFVLVGAYKSFNHDTKDYPVLQKEIKNNSFNAGIGISGEYYYKRFVFNLGLGYKYFGDNYEIRDNTYNNGLPYPVLEKRTKIGAGIGVGFMF